VEWGKTGIGDWELGVKEEGKNRIQKSEFRRWAGEGKKELTQSGLLCELPFLLAGSFLLQ
jgi:hypothetical protein